MIKQISSGHPTDTSWMLLMWFNSLPLLSGFVRMHLLIKLIRGDIFTTYCMVGHTHPGITEGAGAQHEFSMLTFNLCHRWVEARPQVKSGATWPCNQIVFLLIRLYYGFSARWIFDLRWSAPDWGSWLQTLVLQMMPFSVCIGAKLTLLFQAHMTVKISGVWLCAPRLLLGDVCFRWTCVQQQHRQSCDCCLLWCRCCMSCGNHPRPASQPLKMMRLSHAFIILLRLILYSSELCFNYVKYFPITKWIKTQKKENGVHILFL